MTLLKKIPTEVIKEFTKDDGSLTEILTSASATQAKYVTPSPPENDLFVLTCCRIDQAINSVGELKNHQAEPPHSLVKLIEDLCNR